MTSTEEIRTWFNQQAWSGCLAPDEQAKIIEALVMLLAEGERLTQETAAVNEMAVGEPSQREEKLVSAKAYMAQRFVSESYRLSLEMIKNGICLTKAVHEEKFASLLAQKVLEDAADRTRTPDEIHDLVAENASLKAKVRDFEALASPGGRDLIAEMDVLRQQLAAMTADRDELAEQAEIDHERLHVMSPQVGRLRVENMHLKEKADLLEDACDAIRDCVLVLDEAATRAVLENALSKARGVLKKAKVVDPGAEIR